jgi:hypothetical protein
MNYNDFRFQVSAKFSQLLDRTTDILINSSDSDIDSDEPKMQLFPISLPNRLAFTDLDVGLSRTAGAPVLSAISNDVKNGDGVPDAEGQSLYLKVLQHERESRLSLRLSRPTSSSRQRPDGLGMKIAEFAARRTTFFKPQPLVMSSGSSSSDDDEYHSSDSNETSVPERKGLSSLAVRRRSSSSSSKLSDESAGGGN